MKKHLLLSLTCLLLIVGCEEEPVYVREYHDEYLLTSISVSPREINLNAGNLSETLSITNHGDSLLNLRLIHSSELELNITEPEIAPGESVQITINAEQDQILTDSISTQVSILFKEDSIHIPVNIKLLETNKLILPFDIIEALYDKELNRIIITTSGQADFYLRCLTSTGSVTDSLVLDHYPNCMDVSADGTKVIIGQDDRISVIDLTNMSIINEYSMPCTINEILLAPNHYAYAFSDSEEGAYSVNLTTDEITSYEYPELIDQGMRGQLHPSGDYLYLATNHWVPDDLVKMDIRNGSAEYIFESPMGSIYEFRGNLWITSDGEKIITASGVVLNSTESQATDMSYHGTLENDDKITAFCESESSGRVYVITKKIYNHQPKESSIQFYNSNYLNFLGEIEIAPFVRPLSNNNMEYVSAIAHQVFLSPDDNELIVISHAEPGSGLKHTWGIESIPLNQ
ncbi:MAG TPA: hypothetical protein VJ946_14270 [Bacteroidales bacterium]|nr:hypothetical protein [Bacteroidales bacterium]